MSNPALTRHGYPPRLEDTPPPGAAISDIGGEGELVAILGAAQRAKLAANRHKLHWRHGTVTLGYLFDRLNDELAELGSAVETALRSSSLTMLPDAELAAEVWREAADVANFAAMIADLVTRGPA